MSNIWIRQALGSVCVTACLIAGTVASADETGKKPTAASVGITNCDIVASHPHDYERAAPPVEVVRNPAAAIEICAADLERYPDHPRLLLQMGRLYDMKDRDYWEASHGLPWLQKSADQGYLAAIYMLGVVHSKRWGRGRHRVGFDYMLKAARAGHLEAMSRIGVYIGRRSVRAHREEILELMKKAVAMGHADAMANLAKAYIFILADERKHGESVRLLYEAEKKGSLEAMAILGQLQTFDSIPPALRELVPENTFGGMRRLIKAGKKGNEKAAFLLGMLYTGMTFAIPKDQKKSIQWLCRAGRRGQYMVAEMMEKDVRTYRCPKNLSG